MPASDPNAHRYAQTIAVATGAPADRAVAGAPAYPRVPAPSVVARLSAGAAPGERFVFKQILGHGTGGAVWAALDRDLDREVAVKLLDPSAGVDPDAIAAFVDEARIAASLHHPHVVAVHEIGLTSEARPFFVMQRVRGRPLGDVLLASSLDARVAPVSDLNAVVTIFIAVGHALAYAHHRGIVHQDVKPDNIMLGNFGEVALADWGSAIRTSDDRPHIYGTPLYMSPEQARGEAVDVRSDIYGLGASLFHALTLRYPTCPRGEAEFWRRKRCGELDPLEPIGRRRVPPPLLAIALRALAPRAEDRYQSAEAMVDDLRRWQAGLAVRAHRYSWAASFARWHHQHARVFWGWMLAGSAIIACLTLVTLDRLAETGRWGDPVLTERFDDGWRDRWSVCAGEAERDDHGLWTTAPLGTVLFWRVPLSGEVAIELTASTPADAQAGDLSAVWCEGDLPAPTNDPFAGATILFQTGAFDNVWAVITDTTMRRRLSARPLSLVPGRDYRIRAEIAHGAYTLSVDGVVVCRADAPFASGYGHFGLYGYYPRKHFSEVRIWRREPPEKVPVVAIGDSWFQARRYADAQRCYATVAAAHGGELGAEAGYKEGAAAGRAGDQAARERAWAALPPGPWRSRAEQDGLEDLAARGDHAEAVARIRRLDSGPQELRQRLRACWSACAERALTQNATSAYEEYLAAWRDLFPDAVEAQATAADLLTAQRRYSDVVAFCPDAAEQVAGALLHLGKVQEVVERCRFRPVRIAALSWLGRFRDVVSLTTGAAWMCGPARVQCGLITVGSNGVDPGGDDEPHVRLARGEAVAMAEDLRLAPADRAQALLWLDRVDDALAIGPSAQRCRVVAALLADRLDDARTFSVGDDGARLMVARWATLRGKASPDDAVAHQPRDALDDGWAYLDLLAPCIAAAGDRPQLAAMAARLAASDQEAYAGAPWHTGRWLTGAEDDGAFLAQSARFSAPALLALLRGVRAEAAGDADAAVAAYTAYVGLPPGRRAIEGLDRDPVPEAFARARVEALTGHR